MTDDSLHKGLEGVIVAETRLSTIDGEEGELVIGGFPLSELATNATFEETVYLLRNDELPTQSELEDLKAQLSQYRSLPDSTLEVLRDAADQEASGMDALRMGIASASLCRGAGVEEDPELDSLIAIAQMPTITAAYWRLRNDQEVIDPRDDLSHAGNYLYMLTGDEPSDAQVRGLETYLNSVIDHGLNASTFTARSIVSTESDVISAVTGAVGALKGPLHGGAPGPVLQMLKDIHESGDPESDIRGKLEAGERLMGFGHRVYKVRDPRAAVLSSAAEQFYDEEGASDSDFYDTATETEDVAVELLKEYKPDLRLQTNVEFYTAVLLDGIGIPKELFSNTFAVARAGGWTAHCLEQLDDNRLIRPRSRYVGETDRSWTPIDER